MKLSLKLDNAPYICESRGSDSLSEPELGTETYISTKRVEIR